MCGAGWEMWPSGKTKQKARRVSRRLAKNGGGRGGREPQKNRGTEAKAQPLQNIRTCEKERSSEGNRPPNAPTLENTHLLARTGKGEKIDPSSQKRKAARSPRPERWSRKTKEDRKYRVKLHELHGVSTRRSGRRNSSAKKIGKNGEPGKMSRKKTYIIHQKVYQKKREKKDT